MIDLTSSKIKYGQIFVLALVFIALAVQCFYFAWTTGQTTDETFYNGSGYPIVRYNNYKILGEHPPLIMQLGSLPLLLLQPKYPINNLLFIGNSTTEVDISKMGGIFLYHMGNDPYLILFLERTVVILFTLGLGIVLFLWSRRLFGFWGGLVSLGLYSFSPNIIAHGSLYTTDMPVAALYFITIWQLKRWFENSTMANAILVGICLGLALLAKISAVVLMPVILCLFLIYGWSENGRTLKNGAETFPNRFLSVFAFLLFILALSHRTSIAVIGPICLFSLATTWRTENFLNRNILVRRAALGVWLSGWIVCGVFLVQMLRKYELVLPAGVFVWMVCFFAVSILVLQNRLNADHVCLGKVFSLICLIAAILIVLDFTDIWVSLGKFRFFNNYIRSFNIGMSHSLTNHKACTDGSFISCDWRYFLEIMLIKTPASTLGLFLIGLFVFIRSKRCWLDKSLAILPPLAFLTVASALNHINIGVRHVLPVYPFLFLIAGSSATLINNARNVFMKRLLIALVLGAFGILLIRNLKVYPHYLSYFNEFVGSAENGAKLTADSNILWGQDNKQLVALVKKLKIPQVAISSTAMNADEYNYSGISWSYMSEQDFISPKPGFYALDLGSYAQAQANSGSWFKGRQPNYRAGRTFYLFERKQTS